MKEYIKKMMIYLPRSFRMWWGKCFIYMLGKHGTTEFYNDINLYNELRIWLDKDGKPNTQY